MSWLSKTSSKMERYKKSSTSWKFRSVTTMMQGTQIETSLIENLSKSAWKPTKELFGISGMSQTRCMDQNKKIFQLNRPPQRKMFVGDFGWRNQNCSYWEIGVWLSKQRNFENFLKFLTVRNMMEWSQTLVFQPNHPLQMSCLRLGSWGSKSRL